MKNVLITGAAGNLGKAVVEKFLGEGYRVLATVSIGKTSELSGMKDVKTYEADLTDEANAAAVVASAVAEFKTIDAAVLLVGGYASGGIADTDGAGLRKMYALNFETAWFVARPVFLQMHKQTDGGRIILVGSRPSLNPKDGRKAIAYSLAKSLLFKTAEILNEEGAKQNIVTSVIVPSTIDTPVNRKAMPDADFTKWVRPEEIAEVIATAAAGQSVLREPVLKVYGKA